MDDTELGSNLYHQEINSSKKLLPDLFPWIQRHIHVFEYFGGLRKPSPHHQTIKDKLNPLRKPLLIGVFGGDSFQAAFFFNQFNQKTMNKNEKGKM
jgi:hypothetical protein